MEKGVVGKLPKKYDFQSYEKEILEWWRRNRAYMRLKARNHGRKFYFLDGPPYVTNPPHIGTAWNKVLKDVVIRYRRMKGFEVRDQPGYDCHGLPIEVKVEEDLGVKSKKEIEDRITVKTFIDKCKRYALDNVSYQTSIFQDLGVWMDWQHPYLTLQNDYIESVWWTVKRAEEEGLLEKGLRVVHWCPRCETALAGYEVTDEYKVIKDYSIYVKFPLKGERDTSILIWTTTPWTLPANTAVMVHPDEVYVKVEVNDESLIMAERRLRVLSDKLGFEYSVIKRFKGERLEGEAYEYPLAKKVPKHNELKNAHKIVLSREHVNMEEGTGCVHCAPGHGEEDFEVGCEYGLDIISPVDDAGRFTVDAGDYSGKKVKEADEEIIRDLEESKLLFQKSLIEHSYPHCWRCKTPLILRSTEQWFIKITSLKGRLLEENQRIKWAPVWAGKKRFRDWLEGARDWVISRQRFWGVPLPVWVCGKCGRRIVIGSKSELKEKALGEVDVNELDLHRHQVDGVKLPCECGGIMQRTSDIIDVWMDSGVASWASLGYPKSSLEFNRWWPADAIIEAHDQTRGWFYTQLGAGVLCFDRTPYKAVLMHGHTLSPEGQKMSKSLGNFISPMEVVMKYGRDSLRLYVLSCTTWEDFKFSWKRVEEAFKNLQIIWNVYSFASIYMNLDDFKPEKNPVKTVRGKMRREDLWLLSRVESLKGTVTRLMNHMEIHSAVREVLKFAVEDLSHWYVRMVRRRFWLEKESSDKLAAYATLYHALKNCVLMMAPFAPFISEKIYRSMMATAHPQGPISVHHASWPRAKKGWVSNLLEGEVEIIRKIVAASISARQSLKLKLRQPVEELLIFTDDEVVRRAVDDLEQVTLTMTNAKKVKCVSVEAERRLERITLNPRFNVIGPKFRGWTSSIIKVLKGLDPEEARAQIRENGFILVEVGKRRFRISEDMIVFTEMMMEGYAKGVFEGGRVYVKSSLTDELRKEGMVREAVRRLQEMRRQLDLPVDGFISAYISSPNGEVIGWLEREREYIVEEVRATDLKLSIEEGGVSKKGYYTRTWKVDGVQLEMGIKLHVKGRS